VEDMQDT